MMTHMQGWRLSAGDELTVMDGDNIPLLSVQSGAMTRRRFSEAADCARLIAAAPALLKALDLIEGIATGSGTVNSLQHIAKIARQAIALATGEA